MYVCMCVYTYMCVNMCVTERAVYETQTEREKKESEKQRGHARTRERAQVRVPICFGVCMSESECFGGCGQMQGFVYGPV